MGQRASYRPPRARVLARRAATALCVVSAGLAGTRFVQLQPEDALAGGLAEGSSAAARAGSVAAAGAGGVSVQASGVASGAGAEATHESEAAGAGRLWKASASTTAQMGGAIAEVVGTTSTTTQAATQQQTKTRIWFFVQRKNYDYGRYLYWPVLASLSDSFNALGAASDIVGVRDVDRMESHIVSRSGVIESHWIVIFSEPPAKCNESMTEIWEYSMKNMPYYQGNSPATTRFLPPHYSNSLDYGVDLNNATAHQSRTCLLQNKGFRPKLVTEAVMKFFNRTHSLLEVSVNPFSSSRARLRKTFMGCAMGLNMHATGERAVGQMESFRMALFLSNKMCVLSESLDRADVPLWDSLVKMPTASWKPNVSSRIAGLEGMFSIIGDLMKDPLALAECRRKSHELYKTRFSGERVLSSAGINATMLRLLEEHVRNKHNDGTWLRDAQAAGINAKKLGLVV
ncbi:unnamed protein product [Prorocentrum cordatum]|uniref:Uncharacterized protein n=1 Tax=Prorocentrum cordatum TaxID=2364126 RepID=A0ABN9WVI5_9DINO|nr:unnamed protein product [Polarella glacialis]